jgi:hypothetical protein
VTQALGRAEEGEPALLLVAEDVDRDPGGLADLARRLLAVARLADRSRRNRPDRLRSELASEPHLRRHQLRNLLDLRRLDRAISVECFVDPRVGALLHHLLQLPLDRLGDEHAGGVGADIYGSAEHQGVPLMFPDGPDLTRR